MLAPIYNLFGAVMNFFCSITNNNYVLALLLFAVAVKILLLPFSIKQQKNQIKGASLRPKMMAIEKKYAGRNDKATLQKKQNELMELQQKEGYSPLSGCLPLLIQLPIIMILYNIIRNPLTYVCKFTSETVSALATKINELAAGTFADVAKADQMTVVSKIKELTEFNFEEIAGFTYDKLPNFHVFGIDVSGNPEIKSWLVIVPLLVFASQFITMKLSRKLNPTMQVAATQEAQMSNTIMDVMMPLMTLWMAFNFSATIGIYWIYQSVIGLAQMLILAKVMPIPQPTEEELRQAEKEMKAKQQQHQQQKKSGDKPKVRSYHHIDDEDEETTPAPAQKKLQKPSAIASAPIKDESDKQSAKEEKVEAKAEEKAEEKASNDEKTTNADAK